MLEKEMLLDVDVTMVFGERRKINPVFRPGWHSDSDSAKNSRLQEFWELDREDQEVYFSAVKFMMNYPREDVTG